MSMEISVSIAQNTVLKKNMVLQIWIISKYILYRSQKTDHAVSVEKVLKFGGLVCDSIKRKYIIDDTILCYKSISI